MRFELLRLLSDKKYHSGEALGSALKISRAAIWKQVQLLQASGLDIESRRGKGYLWASGTPFLSSKHIQKKLNAVAIRRFMNVQLVDTVDSTNKLMVSAALDGKPSGFTCFAEHQTAGKGRRGREWVSPPAKNIYFSSIFRVDEGVSALHGLSLVVGIAIAEALSVFAEEAVQVKWPNDLILNDKKLGGILIEMVGDSTGHCAAIIGVGLNVHMSESEARGVDQPWTSLAGQCSLSIDRNDVAAQVLNGLGAALDEFERCGFKSFITRWSERHYLCNKAVRIISGERIELGVARGVASDGGLLVQTSVGLKTIYGGEVSVRVDG